MKIKVVKVACLLIAHKSNLKFFADMLTFLKKYLAEAKERNKNTIEHLVSELLLL